LRCTWLWWEVLLDFIHACLVAVIEWKHGRCAGSGDTIRISSSMCTWIFDLNLFKVWSMYWLYIIYFWLFFFCYEFLTFTPPFMIVEDSVFSISGFWHIYSYILNELFVIYFILYTMWLHKFQYFGISIFVHR